MSFTRELEQDADALFRDVAVDCCIPDESFGVSDLRLKLLLSWLQVFGLHDAVEISITEPPLLARQRDESALLHGNQLSAVIKFQCNQLVNRLFNVRKLGFAVVLRGPEMVNGIFDFVLLDVRQIADTPAGVPVEAEKVCVGATTTICVAEPHPALAAVALHGSLEEVRMLP
nr:hypothetical protein [Haematomicrobium sanguinis]